MKYKQGPTQVVIRLILSEQFGRRSGHGKSGISCEKIGGRRNNSDTVEVTEGDTSQLGCRVPWFSGVNLLNVSADILNLFRALISWPCDWAKNSISCKPWWKTRTA